jgi:hypothetical protein
VSQELTPPEDAGFEGESRLVPSEPFPYEQVYHDLDTTEDVPGMLRIHKDDLEEMLVDAQVRAARKILAVVIDTSNTRVVGCRALVLAHVLQTKNRPTQRSLAKRCRITSGRACQLVRAMRLELRLLNAAFRHSGPAGKAETDAGNAPN